jgi:hypothetical protein
MGHYGKFGCALLPLRRIFFYAKGHCGGFGYALWATARNKAVQSKSLLISALWAIAQDLFICYGP